MSPVWLKCSAHLKSTAFSGNYAAVTGTTWWRGMHSVVLAVRHHLHVQIAAIVLSVYTSDLTARRQWKPIYNMSQCSVLHLRLWRKVWLVPSQNFFKRPFASNMTRSPREVQIFQRWSLKRPSSHWQHAGQKHDNSRCQRIHPDSHDSRTNIVPQPLST